MSVFLLGHVEKKYCSKLLDPIGRFQALPLLHKQPITENIQLLSYHNYNGVLYKGCLRYGRVRDISHVSVEDNLITIGHVWIAV